MGTCVVRSRRHSIEDSPYSSRVSIEGASSDPGNSESLIEKLRKRLCIGRGAMMWQAMGATANFPLSFRFRIHLQPRSVTCMRLQTVTTSENSISMPVERSAMQSSDWYGLRSQLSDAYTLMEPLTSQFWTAALSISA